MDKENRIYCYKCVYLGEESHTGWAGPHGTSRTSKHICKNKEAYPKDGEDNYFEKSENPAVINKHNDCDGFKEQVRIRYKNEE